MKIIWSDPAVADLEAIRDYIALDSEHYAARFVARIIDAVEQLETFPKIGRTVPEAHEAPDIREIIFQNYRIIYRLEPRRVLLLAIVHCGRDLSSAQEKPWDVN